MREVALRAGLAAMVVVLVVLTAYKRQGRGREVLLGRNAASSGTSWLGNRARNLEQSAQMLQKMADEKISETKRIEAMQSFLKQARSELKAYSANIDGLVEARDSDVSPRVLDQVDLFATRFDSLQVKFPREAAELHALVDHTLGEADALSLTLAHAPRMPARVSRDTAVVDHALVEMTVRRHVKRAVHSQQLHKSAPVSAREQKVKAVLNKLKQVKEFERKMKNPVLRKEETRKLLGQVTAAAKHGQTHMLVQPGPLLGAMHVRDGALVESDPKYRPADIDQGDEDPQLINNQTVPEYSVDEDKVLLPAPYMCCESLVCSGLGLQHYMPESNHRLNLRVDVQSCFQLIEQDSICREDPEYKKCKLDALEPACDKISEFMPQVPRSSLFTCLSLTDFFPVLSYSHGGGDLQAVQAGSAVRRGTWRASQEYSLPIQRGALRDLLIAMKKLPVVITA
eukprot:766751-Hanusia_phi.AAC.14